MKSGMILMETLNSLEFQLELLMDSSKEAEILYKSIKPEIISSPSIRTESTLKIFKKKVILKVKAQDSTSLRAAVNSYMRWIILSNQVINLEKS
jgi:KEOPS complex subunit Pcc1